DRPLAQRDADRARQLVAVERHSTAVRLHHGQLAQLGALDRGEALAAIGAEAAPADRAAVLGRTAVLHLRVLVATERTAHRRATVCDTSGSGRTTPAPVRRRPPRRLRWRRRWTRPAPPALRRSSARSRGIRRRRTRASWPPANRAGCRR